MFVNDIVYVYQRNKGNQFHISKFLLFQNLFVNPSFVLSIYKFGLSVWVSVCLFVCLYPINVKTAEPIGPKFFVGHIGTPGMVYESSKFQIFVSIKIRSSLNFEYPRFFYKICKLFFLLFYNLNKEKLFPIEIEDGCKKSCKRNVF